MSNRFCDTIILMNFIKHKIKRLYYEIRNLEPIWKFLNRGEIGEWKKENTKLDEEQKRIVGELSQNGIAFSNVEKLGFLDLFLLLQKYTNEKLQSQEIINEIEFKKNSPKGKKGEKTFFIYLFGGDKGMGKIDRENPFLKFSLSKKITDIAGGYLKLKPVFNSFYLMSTIIVSKDSQEYLSQRWHRDPEDKKIVKVFMYLNDVDGGAGPFTYIKGSQYGGKWRHLFPQRPPAGSYPPAGGVEKVISESDIKICTAPAGTIIFCDTSGLHKGGFSTEKSRLMSMSCFVSSASKYPKNYDL